VKRVLLLLTLVVVVAGIVGGTANSEDGPSESPIGCLFFGPDGGLIGGTGVATFYDSGKVVTRCEVPGVKNTTGNVIKLNYANTGASCFFLGHVTTAWNTRIGRDGVAQFTCEFYFKDNVLMRASAAGADAQLG
jgi:hypothetical protein